MATCDAANSSSLTEWLKWSVPVLLSITVFLRSLAEQGRSRSENSSRARQQYNEELRNWSSTALDVLSESATLCVLSNADPERLSLNSSKLSSLADQGRLFFPNNFSEEHGQHKDFAFRGFRPRILDWLVYACRLLGVAELPHDRDAQSVLVALKRGFVSDMQVVLDPRNLNASLEDFQKMLSESDFMEVSQSHQTLRSADKLVESRRNFSDKKKTG